MGVMYIATDTRLDRQVAIKALPEHLSSGADRLVRFQREAKVLASLNYPSIGAIYGIEEANGQQYLVRINVGLLGFQKRRRKLRDSRRTEDGHVRRVRDDRQAVWRSQRSVEAGVALSAAQQFVELHDVFRANRIGIRKHEQSRRLDVGHGGRPIKASIGELTSLPEHSFPVHGRIK